MTRRKIARPLAALALAGGLSACAHEPFNDPLFWHGVALGAELAAVVVALEQDCWTRYDAWGYAYTVCDDDLPPPRPHRPRR